MRKRNVLYLASLILIGSSIPAIGDNPPEAIFESYKKALQENNSETYLSLVTQESREIVTAIPSRMQLEFKTIDGLYYEVDQLAEDQVEIRFVPENREAAPYLLHLEDNVWKVDLAAMRKRYIFDVNDAWQKKE